MTLALLNTDFIAGPIMQRLPARAKRSTGRRFDINCPLCLQRGESRPDTRLRCAVFVEPGEIGLNCKNCGAKTRYKPGDRLPRTLRDFLSALGVPEMEVLRINHHAATLARMAAPHPTVAATVVQTAASRFFPDVQLPPGARPIFELFDEGFDDPDFLKVAAYFASRGDELAQSTTFYWSPDPEHAMNLRFIVPFYHHGRIVGWTARAADPAIQPKYWAKEPHDFLFNSEAMDKPWRKYVILVEGSLDALVLDGVALLKSTISPTQIAWINASGKRPILLADRDRAGDRLIDIALSNRWMVSFPKLKEGSGVENWWEPDVKDAAEAAKRYGRLYTLRSVVESATDNALKIRMLRKLQKSG